MKYNEVFTLDNGMFEVMFKPNFADGYTTIFGDLEPNVLDTTARLCAGNKTLLSTVTFESAPTIVNSIISMNLPDWVKAAKAMLAEYDMLKPVQRVTTRQSDATATETTADHTEDSIKAFNDVEFSPDSKTANNSDKQQTRGESITSTVAGIGQINPTDAIRKEFSLRLDKWRKSIIFAIINEITNEIY